MTNTLKTAVLLAGLTALLLVVGQVLGGSGGLTIALILALGMNALSYWFSDRIALAMTGAREVSLAEAPELHALVARVAAMARLPKPRVYIIDSASPNAFATGRDPGHAAVAVTTGILRVLSPEELEGVLAHEMAHIRNRDTLIATIAATIAGAITYLAQMGQWAFMFGGYGGRRDDREGGLAGLEALLMIILAPLAAVLIQLAISRSREFNADATGARITGNPLALADALERLERAIAYRPMTNVPAVTAPLFIMNPLGPGMLQKLFSDHPPTAERVARLRKMAFEQIR
ncbi:MAG: zinc metalloprotease HtpX [Chloroflexi bacterium]|jgi:heat shock protein HtpX|nr:zinc metalloprotease HtpX [Chloroflexota bacterium]HLG51136.1 zinc metalloprotease HtpX [Chloroflexota bacterium]